MSSSSYSDKFVTVDPTTHTLTVHNYRLTHPSLVLKLSSIEYLLPAPTVTKRLGMKAWGFGVTGVSWARDWERLDIVHREKVFERSFVLKCRESRVRVGFSVEDREGFLQALEAEEPGLTTRQPGEGELDDMSIASEDSAKLTD